MKKEGEEEEEETYIAGVQMVSDRIQAQEIMRQACLVVLLARYVSGRVTEKYLSNDMISIFKTAAFEFR